MGKKKPAQSDDGNASSVDHNCKNQECRTPLRKLPNINNWMNIAKLSDIKNLNLTRLAMPNIAKQSPNKYPVIQLKEDKDSLSDNEDVDYKHHCGKCNASFFYEDDLQKHDAYSDCIHRPYLCPFCEKPFKSCLAVKKHCTNMHSSIINWDLVGGLLAFVKQNEHMSADQAEDETDYILLVRKYARDHFMKKLQNGKAIKEPVKKVSNCVPVIDLVDGEEEEEEQE